jgi:hypothetical protein
VAICRAWPTSDPPATPSSACLFCFLRLPKIHILENRLNKRLVRHSEISQTNRNLKAQVDTARRAINNRRHVSNKVRNEPIVALHVQPLPLRLSPLRRCLHILQLNARFKAKEEQLRQYLDASERSNEEREEVPLRPFRYHYDRYRHRHYHHLGTIIPPP